MTASTVTHQLSTDQLTRLHARLEEQRAFRVEQLAELERARHRGTVGGAVREINLSLQRGARAALHDVQVALWQLEEGDYGRCAVCGDALDPAQLRSVPQAMRCASCRGPER